MIASLVRRELRGRYKGTALGFLWTFINPLMQLIVYTFVFSIVMRNGVKDYYLFLFVALIPWLFFSGCISTGSNCVYLQKELVKKIYFPREVLPISFVTAQFVNMLLCFIIVFAALIVTGKGVAFVPLLYLPLIMIIEYILALGFTFLFSALTVYVRDLQYSLSIVVMAWQFMTPVMYSSEMVPERLRKYFYLNPMTSVIEAYRSILYYKQVPQVSTLTIATVLGVVLLFVGYFAFRKLERGFAENM